MISQIYIPSPPLSDFVEMLWYQEGYTPPHPREYCFPDGAVELVINLHEDRLPLFNRHNPAQFEMGRGSVVCGVHSEYFVIDTSHQQSIIGVHFKPGGAFPFFQFPTSELHNTVLSLDMLWGTSADDLRCCLLEARTIKARFQALEQFLLGCAVQPMARNPAVLFALGELQRPANPRRISDVAEQIGLSSKRFIQLFSNEVGLTPKLFHRVQRFQSVLRRIRQGKQVDWVDMALDCGYFDQAHFIHDFRAFSGMNPGSYQNEQSERSGHVALWS